MSKQLANFLCKYMYVRFHFLCIFRYARCWYVSCNQRCNAHSAVVYCFLSLRGTKELLLCRKSSIWGDNMFQTHMNFLIQWGITAVHVSILFFQDFEGHFWSGVVKIDCTKVALNLWLFFPNNQQTLQVCFCLVSVNTLTEYEYYFKNCLRA